MQAGGYADAAEATVEALRLAGAEVIRVVLPADGWSRLSVDDAGAESAVVQEARALAPLLSSGSDAALQAYRDRGELAGDAVTGGAFSLVALVGGAPSPARTRAAAAAVADEPVANWLAHTRDLALTEVWKNLGVTVIGAEPFDADISFMRAYQSAGIATIDAIDRPLGKIALPFALLGEKIVFG